MQRGLRHLDVSVRSRVSLHVGDVPVDGPVLDVFAWDDLLDAPPPHRSPAPRRYCVPGPEIVAGGERVETAVLVGRDADGVLHLDHRLGVIRRVMGRTIARERTVVASRLQDWPRPLARAVRAVTRGATALPDRMRSRAAKATELLGTRAGRERFVQGLRDPHALSGQQKAITLFLGVASVVATILLAYVVVAFVAPSVVPAWRVGVLLYLVAFAHSLGAPVLWEPVLLGAALATAPLVAALVGTGGKVTAAYLAAYLGDEVNDGMERRAERHPLFARFLHWSERFARRFGVVAVAVFVATPGLPDAFVIYSFASLRMPVGKFLLAVAIGSLTLNLAIVLGVKRLIGL